MAWSNRLAHVLTLLVLAATGIAILLMVVIAVNPSVSFNPYPPSTLAPLPSLSPSPTATARMRTPTPAATLTPLPYVTPTPLRPSTATPTPELVMPFSYTTNIGSSPPLLNCTRPLLSGSVLDEEEEDLIDYPIHVWGPSLDTIVRSGSDTRYGSAGWSVDLPEGGAVAGPWYVQLHLYDIRRAHPPLSGVVELHLDEDCPQAYVLFQASP